MPNSAQTKTTGPPSPSIGVSGRARSSSSTLLRAGRSARASGRARRPIAAGCGVRSASWRTGLRALSSQACGSSERKSSGPVRVPRPAVVERDPRERRELRRQPPRELGGALVRLPRARERCDVDDPGRAHGAQASRGRPRAAVPASYSRRWGNVRAAAARTRATRGSARPAARRSRRSSAVGLRSARSSRFSSATSSARRLSASRPIRRRSVHGCAGTSSDLRVILERHGGTVEKFVGDAVMAVFGDPASRTRTTRCVRPAPRRRCATRSREHGLEAPHRDQHRRGGRRRRG